jgi:hypothetical protein
MSASIFTVIHHRDLKTSIENARISAAAGAAGVFLIDMTGDDEAAFKAAEAVRGLELERDLSALDSCKAAINGQRFQPLHDRLLVGINALQMPIVETIARAQAMNLDAIWADNPGLDSIGRGPLASDIAAQLSQGDALFFGSVAFKTQAEEPDPAGAAMMASLEGWVPTTSGPGTGMPPQERKLSQMKRAIGDHPLAVASGISPKNARNMARYCDWILAATGISRDFHNLCPDLTKALVGAAAAA